MRSLLLALPLAVLAGCGGDDRMSPEEFRTEANAVCSSTEQRLQGLGAPEDSAEGVAEYAGGAVPILEERHERLEELRPPEGEEGPYEALLEEAAAELDALRALRKAAEDGNQAAAAAAASRGRVATVRVNVLAVRLEIRDCVRRPRS